VVDQLAMKQDNSEKEVRGPSTAKAFGADGNVTKVWLHISENDYDRSFLIRGLGKVRCLLFFAHQLLPFSTLGFS
jgi:hypothetical protein